MRPWSHFGVTTVLLLSWLYANGYHMQKKKFNFESLFDIVLPVIHPIVSAGSDRCESLKNLLGLTYEQMREKNRTDLNEHLHIDLITKTSSFTYNLTATRRLSRIMMNVKTIIILIHGFMESSDGLMVQAVAPELLKRRDLPKVLALDGRNLITLEYFRSSTYARMMGEKLGTMLAEMVQYGIDPSNITLIGHSLGAHIAGCSGKRVKKLTGKPLGRIAALDPAGPCFTGDNPDGTLCRLSPSDAQRVEVIHTNGGILGLKEPVGRIDFYPNGGWTQPGCFLSLCDHSRAWRLFADSINYPRTFPAWKCENWTMFREGNCSKNEIAYMGFGTKKNSPGSYFLSTNSKSPFGQG